MFRLYLISTLVNYVVRYKTDKKVDERLRSEDFIIKEDKERNIKNFIYSLIPIYHLYDSYKKIFDFDSYYYEERKNKWTNGLIYKEWNSKVDNTVTTSKKEKNYDSVTNINENFKEKEKDKVLVKKKKL